MGTCFKSNLLISLSVRNRCCCCRVLWPGSFTRICLAIELGFGNISFEFDFFRVRQSAASQGNAFLISFPHFSGIWHSAQRQSGRQAGEEGKRSQRSSSSSSSRRRRRLRWPNVMLIRNHEYLFVAAAKQTEEVVFEMVFLLFRSRGMRLPWPLRLRLGQRANHSCGS